MNGGDDKENKPDLEVMVRRIVREEISECGCLCGEGKALKSSLSQILDVMVRERVHLTFASLQRR